MKEEVCQLVDVYYKDYIIVFVRQLAKGAVLHSYIIYIQQRERRRQKLFEMREEILIIVQNDSFGRPRHINVVIIISKRVRDELVENDARVIEAVARCVKNALAVAAIATFRLAFHEVVVIIVSVVRRKESRLA
jgi:hypothetical protein